MQAYACGVVHVLAVLALPPLLWGVINRVKALVAGRVGPPLAQPYYDLFRLFRKGTVLSPTTTWLFRAAPAVAWTTTFLAALLIPLVDSHAVISFRGDAILFAYLLGLGRFFTTAAALDTGSSFEGMGAAREATFACLTEPAIFLGMLALAKLSGSIQMAGMLGGPLAAHWQTAGAPLALVLISWSIVLLAENSRIPFDDPNTHLELTMIHEVMVLDHSGPAFGLILYGAAMKLLVFAAVLLRLMLPLSTGFVWLDWGVFVGGVLVIAAAIGVVESAIARLRMAQAPVLLVAACLLSAFAVIIRVR